MTTLAVRLFYRTPGTFSSADTSNLLISINGSPRGPEAKHLRPRRTPINGVYAAGRLSFHSPFSQMYVLRAVAERSLSGTPMHLLIVDAPNRAVPKKWNVPCKTGAFTRFRFLVP